MNIVQDEAQNPRISKVKRRKLDLEEILNVGRNVEEQRELPEHLEVQDLNTRRGEKRYVKDVRYASKL